MDDPPQGPVPHIFQDPDPVPHRERQEQHFQHKADVQTVMQGYGERKYIKIDQCADKESGEQNPVCNDEKPRGPIATVPD
jgi:hypothetical protein